MNRRTLLIAVGASTVGLGGCTGSSPTGDDDSDETVEQTPDGVSAVYTYFKDVDFTSVPDVDDPIVLTERTEISQELDHDGLIEFAESVNFDDSYLVVSSNETHVGNAAEIAVDALKETPQGIQFDVHTAKEYADDASELYDRITDVVGIEVTTENQPPGSVTVEWFKPHRCQAPYAPYQDLPAPVKREVDGALDDGDYTVDGPLLYPQAVTEDAILWKDDDYYQSRIREKDGMNVLQFEPTTAGHGDSTGMYFDTVDGNLHSEHDEELKVSVVITDLDENVLVDEELLVQPYEYRDLRGYDEWGSPSVEIDGEYGTYSISIETDEEIFLDESITIDPMHRHRIVLVSPDGDGEIFSDYTTTYRSTKPPRYCATAGGWWGYEGMVGTGTNPGQGPWQ